MKINLLIILLALGFIGCKENAKQTEDKKDWAFATKIQLPQKTRPLAIVKTNGHFWVSDPENLRVLKIDSIGNVLDSIGNLKRPMNIDYNEDTLYIPEFLTDSLWSYASGSKNYLDIKYKPDAPSGITVKGDTLALADFYNHTIFLKINEDTLSIGKEGHAKGELYYPTDIKVDLGKIYVADAYNNRIQVFDLKGNSLATIGEKDGLKVASAISIYKNQLAVTDQENNRVLIYNKQGDLIQIIKENILYPTDVLLTDTNLYVANFKENTISIFRYE